MLYWNSGPIWCVGGSRKWKALPLYGSSKIKFVDRLVASIFPRQDGCLSDITCLRHPQAPDKPYLHTGQSVSVSERPSAAERRARDVSKFHRATLSATGRKIRGRPVKTFAWRTSPPQTSSLPETSLHTADRRTCGEKRYKKRFQVKCRLFFFAAVCGAVVKICS